MFILAYGNVNYVFIGYLKKIIYFYNNVMANLNMVKTNSFYLKMVDCSLFIGYEYMGLNGRLVITPLTDRIYLTITQVNKSFNILLQTPSVQS